MNINDLVHRFSGQVKKHQIKMGSYQRWLWQDKKGTRDLGITPYGCADAANILYTIGEFPTTYSEREAFIKQLQSLQDKNSGLFEEQTHHPIHTTAHCSSALELFDARPVYPFFAFEKYKTIEGLYELLDSIDWTGNCWSASHQPAGIYAALVVNNHVNDAWKKAYFDWFWKEADPQTGLWRKNCQTNSKLPLYYHMAGTFHYLFNHEYARMPLRYPEKLIDTCLDLYSGKKMGEDFGKNCGFLEIDWVYCLTRASRQTPHRFAEIKEILWGFAQEYIAYLVSLDWEQDECANDLHALFGAVCCVAELQTALPGKLITSTPLKLVLDRRPFI